VPRLSVVVVNHRRWQDTAALVRQLRASPCLRGGDAEVVVVDNASPPGPVLARLRRLAGVSLRRWRRNRGFARAVNEGCRLARGDWFLLLNPDVTVPADFLDRALDLAERLAVERPRTGIVGFRLDNPDRSVQHSTGPFPTLLGTLARLALPRSRRKYSQVDDSRLSRVDWATGCCLLVRRACWEQLGGFDPRFFLYYEDVDLCLRARRLGWDVCHEPSLGVVHHRPLHRRDVTPLLRLFTRHALLTYARTHWRRWQFRLLAGVVRLETWWRRRRARKRGDREAAHVFATLSRVVSDLEGGREVRAGRRLRRLVWQQEERRAPTPVDRDPQPQPARPAAPLPGKRDPACAGG
jgi:GT2 family glycosyltransferase